MCFPVFLSCCWDGVGGSQAKVTEDWQLLQPTEGDAGNTCHRLLLREHGHEASVTTHQPRLLVSWKAGESTRPRSKLESHGRASETYWTKKLTYWSSALHRFVRVFFGDRNTYLVQAPYFTMEWYSNNQIKLPNSKTAQINSLCVN